MLKRLFLAGLLSLGISSAFAAGTIPFSLSQQFDSLGKPLANCFFYTIQAGTTSTPQNAYQDSALTLPQPNPMRCDASGRLPQFFLADGLIKVRITDKNGTPQAYPNGANGIDNIQVIGPSGGGGGGGTVDPTTIAQTGDLKVAYGTSVLTGWVRANGRTIGSATSGATERANADCQTLFQYLWGADANLAVSGGRGASAAADWAANKTIALPDWRGRSIAGLDDMGNSPAGVLTGGTNGFGGTGGGNPIVLGQGGGVENSVLATTNLPPYTPSVASATTNVLQAGGAVQGQGVQTGAGNLAFGGGASGASPSPLIANTTVTMNAQGGTSTRFATISPTRLATIYIKL